MGGEVPRNTGPQFNRRFLILCVLKDGLEWRSGSGWFAGATSCCILFGVRRL